MYKTTISNPSSNLKNDTNLLSEYLKTHLGGEIFEVVSKNLKLSLAKGASYEEAVAEFTQFAEEKKYLPLLLHYLQLEKCHSIF